MDAEVAKMSMPRDAHIQIMNILQAFERQAQVEKMREAARAAVPEQK